MQRKFLPYRADLKTKAKDLRNNPTRAESKLWFEYLRMLPIHFYRQKPILHYIVDFYSPKLKLAIEVDGDSHFTEEGEDYDKKRTIDLGRLGLTVLRFNNDQVLNHLEGVCSEIECVVREKSSSSSRRRT